MNRKGEGQPVVCSRLVRKTRQGERVGKSCQKERVARRAGSKEAVVVQIAPSADFMAP